MKKKIFLQSLICLLAVSCTVRELDTLTPDQSKGKVFYATIESDSEPDTKVSLDYKNLKVFWNARDQISIFNKSTLNQPFQFAGEDGKNSGEFHWVESDYFGAGNDFGFICAVYPYQESTTISNSGDLTLTLPAVQTYAENSFGRGANTMVSVTDASKDDNLLMFKNVGCYMAFRFWGSNITVKSITLAGNSGEQLAGKATMRPVINEDPSITWASTAGKSIALDCGEVGVQLGASEAEATVFWLVVPPTSFVSGFTITVTDMNDNVFIKSTTNPLILTRNNLVRVSPIQVDFNFDSSGLHFVSEEEKAISPVNSNTKYKTEVDETNRTVTVTMPTVTDFSNLLFNYRIQGGDQVMVNGITLVNGETPIDVFSPIDIVSPIDQFTKKASLVIRNGNYGKSYKLLVRNTGLPVVRITTEKLSDGSNGFTVDYLESFKNRLQNSEANRRDTFDRRVWLPEDDDKYVSLCIEKPDGSPGMKDGNNPVYRVNTKIKGRGNYSWKWEKKPYALKFENKRAVLGMENAHKRWILLANWRDRTLLRNDAAFWLSRRSGLPYTVSGEFVELEINGEYRGNYYLCEQIKIDENRVNITEMKEGYKDKTGGFLMEIDSYFDEIRRFKSSEFNLKYMFKEPEVDVKTDTTFKAAYHWMKKRIDSFEKVLKSESGVRNHLYANYLDVSSAIKFVMLNELTGNRDFFQNGDDTVFGPHSTYLYKDKGINAKIFMGPIWDFDYETFIPEKYYPKEHYYDQNGSFSWRGFDNQGYYFYYMCYDQQFVNAVKSFWRDFKSEESLKTEFAAYINQMAEKIRYSQYFDEKRWPGSSQTNRNDNHDYTLDFLNPDKDEDAIRRMINSFNARVDWMNDKITNLTTTSPHFEYN